MKIQHLSLAVSLATLACGAEDPSTSSGVLGAVGAGASPNGFPGATAGAGASGTGLPGSGASGSSGTFNPTGAGGMAGVCAVSSVDSGRVTPDMLIVLDRSGSMRSGNVNRWDPSVSALKSITASLSSTINFGLMTFPGTSQPAAAAPAPMQDCSALTDIVQQLACVAMGAAGSIGALDTCVPGTVEVPIGPNNAMAISSALDRMMPLGATPTAVSLKAAHTAIGSGVAALDSVVKPKYVLLVTDGAPNCSAPNSTGGPGARGGFDSQAVDQSVAEIEAMAKDGVKTYVIGYNTKSDPQLSAALDRMAKAGNTGDMQHHAIEDGMALQTEFQKIAGAVASCELALGSVTSDPRYVQVKLDDKQINLNDANGWEISADGRRITLKGSACEAISSLAHHVVSIRVLCEPVTLQ